MSSKNFRETITSLVDSVFVTTNAGKACSYGVEFQGGWRLILMLEAYATAPPITIRVSPTAPMKATASVLRALDYTSLLSGSLEVLVFAHVLHVRLSYVYRNKIFFSDDNYRLSHWGFRASCPTSIYRLILGERFSPVQLPCFIRALLIPASKVEVAFIPNLADTDGCKRAGSAGGPIALPNEVSAQSSILTPNASLSAIDLPDRNLNDDLFPPSRVSSRQCYPSHPALRQSRRTPLQPMTARSSSPIAKPAGTVLNISRPPTASLPSGVVPISSSPTCA